MANQQNTDDLPPVRLADYVDPSQVFPGPAGQKTRVCQRCGGRGYTLLMQTLRRKCAECHGIPASPGAMGVEAGRRIMEKIRVAKVADVQR